MKIAVNREYMTRHLGVAVLFIVLGLWFLYDAVFVYPNVPVAPGEHRTSISFQYSSSALLIIASIIIAFRARLSAHETLEWDGEKMWGSLTGGREIPLSDVKVADWGKWDRKRILVLVTREGRFISVDGWHHTGVDELAKILGGSKDEPPSQK